MKRDISLKVNQILDEKRIPVLMGLRRIGKTTLLEQMCKEHKKSIIVTFDDILNLLKSEESFFTYIFNLAESEEIEYLFLDEVQVRKNWDILIKNLFDKYVKNDICKVVVTGSSSMQLLNKDMGANRTERIILDTWSFGEYLKLTQKEKSFENFEMFLGRGFPEYFDHKRSFSEMLNSTFKPLIVDDIPKAYPGTDTLALFRFVNEISRLSNGEVNETKIAQKTSISLPTVRKYFNILENAMIIHRVYKIHQNGTFPKKKSYKVFLNPHIHVWLLGRDFSKIDDKFKGHIIESYWLHKAKSNVGYWKTFYYLKDSTTNKEIDFVSLNNDGSFKTLHEFKYRNKIDEKDLKQLRVLKSDNKVVWCKENKSDPLIKYLSIIDY